MKRDTTPTLLELAELFDQWSMEVPNPALQHTLRWLIDHSAAARALEDRLHQRQAGQPSPKDLGELLLAVQSTSYSPATDATLHWLIQRSPEVRKRADQLEQLLHDCAIVDSRPSRLSYAVDIEAELEHWLTLLDEDPDYPVELKGEAGWEENIYHLLSLCRARIGRLQDREKQGREKRRLEHLRELLQQAAERAVHSPSDEQRLAEMLESMAGLLEPMAGHRPVGEARATVEELVARLRAGASSAPVEASVEGMR